MGNLLTFVSFCDKNMGVQVICGAGYSPENTVYLFSNNTGRHFLRRGATQATKLKHCYLSIKQ